MRLHEAMTRQHADQLRFDARRYHRRGERVLTWSDMGTMSSGRRPISGRRPHLRGFTLIELLVLILIIAILVAILSPVLSSVRMSGEGLKCMSNVKQLQFAWLRYAEDNRMRLVSPGGWALGNFTNPSGPDNTDLKLLRDGLLFKYVEETGVYKCPGDNSVNVRSYAVNNHMGGLSFDGAGRVFRNLNLIRRPHQFFVFVDEALSTINDSLFRVDVAPASTASDNPAKYHNQASRFSFADGRAEGHTWTKRVPEDKQWLKQHTSPVR